MEESNKPLKEYLLIKTNFIEIIIVALVLAFGVSITVSSVTLIKGYNINVGIIFGIILCILSLSYLILRNINKLSINRWYEGFICYNKNDKRIIEVSRYDFLKSLAKNLESGFLENSALKNMWEKDSLDSCITFDKKSSKCILRKTKSSELLVEAIEYYILNKLSIHLTDYFNQGNFKKTDLKTFKRNELPEVLLSNRFLELFSKPMEERACFVDEIKEFNDQHGKTMSMYKNGFMFEEFELVLPKGSNVKRNKENQICISTKRFKMGIDIKFDGTSTVLPSGFEKYYMNINNPIESGLTSYVVKIHIDIKFSFLYLFTIRRWKYYSWIDSFLNKLDREISKDNFFKRIHWENVLTVIHCINFNNKDEKNINTMKKNEVMINIIINELCDEFLENNEHINSEDLRYMTEYVLRNPKIKSKLNRNETSINYIEEMVKKHFNKYVRSRNICI